MTRPRKKVVAVGLAVMDKIFRVPSIPIEPTKVFARSYAEIGGGPAATGAVAVARLGGAAELWTRVGDDAVGRQILAELRHWGVTPFARAQEGALSNVSAVLVDDRGERMLASFTDPALDTDPSWLPLECLAADAVLGDVRWPEGSAAVFRRARALRIPTVLDADLAPDNVLEALLPLADYAVFSQPALTRFVGIGDVIAALTSVRDACPGMVGVTVGEDGFTWLDQSGARTEPGFAVPVVDTLGAGDVFHGAFALAIAEGRPIRETACFANAAAGLKCTRAGGRAGIPRREDVEALLAIRL
ncbi:MAG TPA: PfkB family carbohydrate kinase [Salinarimonas sp.]|jgi:sulfofructose kinase|nr:PfkB family carbohydrate kinase [Salinarimonas sp.]